MGVQEERRETIIELKSKPCTDCGAIFPYFCMDFDHVPERGKKCFEVNLASGVRKPIAEVMAELEKCDLVCVICHRIRTNEREYPGVGANHKIECTNGHDLTDPYNWKMENGKRKGCAECHRIRVAERYHGENNDYIKAQQRIYEQKQSSLRQADPIEHEKHLEKRRQQYAARQGKSIRLYTRTSMLSEEILLTQKKDR